MRLSRQLDTSSSRRPGGRDDDIRVRLRDGHGGFRLCPHRRIPLVRRGSDRSLISSETAMIKGDILARYKSFSPEERSCFDRWMRANAVAGSIFAVALVTMALASSRAQETGAATVPASASAQAISFHELHGQAHLDNLPVDQFHNQALVFTASEAEAARSAMASEPGREIA